LKIENCELKFEIALTGLRMLIGTQYNLQFSNFTFQFAILQFSIPHHPSSIIHPLSSILYHPSSIFDLRER